MIIEDFDISVLKPDDVVLCEFPTDKDGYPLYDMFEVVHYFERIHSLVPKNTKMVLMPDNWGLKTMKAREARKYISSIAKGLGGKIIWSESVE